MFGTQVPSLDPVFSQQINMPTPQAPQQGGGMFGSKFGIAQGLLAAVNGYLASRGNPVGISNLQAMQEAYARKQQQSAEAQQYQQHRQDSLTDQLTLLDYKAQHPEQPDIAQRISVLNGIEPGLGATYAHNYAANGGGSMIQFTDPQTGQRYMMPSQGALPSAPVGKLTPLDDGGQTALPSGGFPR